jgi:hypothetical protein
VCTQVDRPRVIAVRIVVVRTCLFEVGLKVGVILVNAVIDNCNRHSFARVTCMYELILSYIHCRVISRTHLPCVDYININLIIRLVAAQVPLHRKKWIIWWNFESWLLCD